MMVVESSSTMESFQKYADMMKKSQDKHERIFKVRRDIVIESKRIIFLLLSIDKSSKRDQVIAEAEKKIQNIISSMFSKIATELVDEDPYKYYRAISPGNQEFIEALTLLEFARDGEVKGPCSVKSLPFVPSLDYILGLADLTGEIMRQTVSSIGTGNTHLVPKYCEFLQKVHSVMMALPYNKELSGKLPVMEASVCKVERISYQLHLMGNQTEHILPLAVDDRDEGYQD